MRKYKFNTVGAREATIDWIKAESGKANFNKVVIGISGGKDSTIAAALCCRALGKENVHGLLLPNGLQHDFDDSVKVCKALGIRYDTINIKPLYDSFLLQYTMCTSRQEYEVVNNIEDARSLLDRVIDGAKDEQFFYPSQEAVFNLAPRIRMTMLRLWGQTNHHRLCGTSNYSEITVGYCTKDGDTSNDFNPLAKLTSLEVVAIGLTMEEIPRELVLKAPEDGLTGLTDEEKLGVTYEEIHNYIRGLSINKEVWKKIHAMELAGLHKREKREFNIPEEYLYTQRD